MVKKITSRHQALNILLLVLKNKMALDEAFSRILTLTSRDDSFVKALCFGVLREQERLKAIALQLLKKPLKEKQLSIEILLMMGLYQLNSMGVKEHAAVAETVEVARDMHQPFAVSLLNALLRRFLREKAVLLDHPAVKNASDHPDWLVKRMQTIYPLTWQRIVTENNTRAPMSLRVNTAKISVSHYLQQLQVKHLNAKTVSGAQEALILDQPVAVSELPGFLNGLVFVQDIGAQYAANLMDLKPHLRVLDACAAPGGKTTHLLARCASIHLTAMDNDIARLPKIQENLKRLGLSANVILGDASQKTWPKAQLFDRILLDAPCSGTGVIRRHPDIKWLRRDADIKAMQKTQITLLHHLWEMLVPGGILVYVTCSILPEENDAPIKTLLDVKQDLRCIPLQFERGVKTDYGWQFLPQQGAEDGFYYAKLSKA